MEISEVRVKLVNNKDDRLKAFCSVTMDNEFVVRDIKVIEGVGGFFVAMPSVFVNNCRWFFGRKEISNAVSGIYNRKILENMLHYSHL